MQRYGRLGDDTVRPWYMHFRQNEAVSEGCSFDSRGSYVEIGAEGFESLLESRSYISVGPAHRSHVTVSPFHTILVLCSRDLGPWSSFAYSSLDSYAYINKLVRPVSEPSLSALA
jgi:hypothetical protein